MQRSSLARRWIRGAAIVGSGAALAGWPLLPAVAGAGTHGYAVTTIKLDGTPGQVAVDPATGTVYVPTTNVDVINESKGAVTRVLKFGRHIAWATAVDAKTDTVYVGLTRLPTLDVLNGATDAVTASFSLPGAPEAIALNSDGSVLYEAYGNSVSAINPATGAVTSTVDFGRYNLPSYLAVDTATGTVYAAGPSPTGSAVWQLDVGPLAVKKTFALDGGLEGLAVNTVTDKIYIAGVDAGGNVNHGVNVIDGATGHITFIDTHWPTNGVTVDAATNTVFAALGAQVAVVDGATSKVTMFVPATSFDFHGGIAADPHTGKVFAAGVVNIGADVTMLTPGTSPVITSASKATFRVGTSRRFRVTTSGFPAPTLTEKGRLPRGFSFRANPNGTATITGRPVRSEIGQRFTIKIVARNGIGKAATQELTIVIRRAG